MSSGTVAPHRIVSEQGRAAEGRQGVHRDRHARQLGADGEHRRGTMRERGVRYGTVRRQAQADKKRLLDRRHSKKRAGTPCGGGRRRWWK